ncbi:MAG TPA: sulfite exporter TauE/SafE family protein, partial [Coriobacteriia bacterium]
MDGVAKFAVGLFSGVLSGAFGVGGGLITTPAIRLLLGYPALIAVGTPLPVILPGAVTGAATYWKRGSADVRAGITMGLIGSIGSVAGAMVSQ